MNPRFRAIAAACVAVLFAAAASVWACPFCNVESQTLSEETDGADAVVLAKLVKEAPATARFDRSELGHGDISDRRGAEGPGSA